jgi:NADPH:quinone reductase-like Zn-dependent oxidoreductase
VRTSPRGATLRPDPRHRRERVAVTPAAGLAPKGTLVIVGGEAGGRWFGGDDRQLRALLLSRFVGQKLTTFISKENHQDMLILKELIEAGKVTPVIDRTYPLSEAPQAIRYLEEGHARGKVVITV